MPLTNLCDDVFQSMLEYLEYEEIARLSRVGAEVFLMCDDYVQRDVGVSVADLYHFTDDSHRGCVTAAAESNHSHRGCVTAAAESNHSHRGCVTAAKKIEIGADPVLWVAPATNTLDYSPRYERYHVTEQPVP